MKDLICSPLRGMIRLSGKWQLLAGVSGLDLAHFVVVMIDSECSLIIKPVGAGCAGIVKMGAGRIRSHM